MNQRQQHMPIWDALRHMAQASPARFHVPGHKGGHFFAQEAQDAFASILELDFTELAGLDDLHDPRGIIAKAQELAAEVFQADQTHFLVGGSTLGNMAMILGTVGRGEQILVGRHSHKSVFHALRLAEAEVILLEPEICPDYQVPLGISTRSFQQALAHFPQAKAVLLTYPNYYGQALDIGDIIRLAHEEDVTVLIDEAHGAHFGQDQVLPPAAMQLGADVSVQSTHKMLASMTMTSMLHIRGDRARRTDIEYYIHSLQSSSPSYPLLASLDVARAEVARLQKEDWQQAIDVYHDLREELRRMGYVVSDGPSRFRHKDQVVYVDPFKLIVRAPQGWSGFQLQKRLQNRNIYVELADPDQVLVTLPLFPHRHWNQQLLLGLKELREQYPQRSFSAENRLLAVDQEILAADQQKKAHKQWQVLHPEEMNRKETEDVQLREASGRIAAEMMIPYPPGVPLLIPGEKITEQVLSCLQNLQAQGAYFQGKHREHWTTLKVFK